MKSGSYVGFFRTNCGANNKLLGSATIIKGRIVSFCIHHTPMVAVDEFIAQARSFDKSVIWFVPFNLDVLKDVHIGHFEKNIRLDDFVGIVTANNFQFSDIFSRFDDC